MGDSLQDLDIDDYLETPSTADHEIENTENVDATPSPATVSLYQL